MNVTDDGTREITYSWQNINVYAKEEKRFLDRRKKGKDGASKTKHILKDGRFIILFFKTFVKIY